MARSIFLSSLLSLCIAAPLAGIAAIGCAAPTDSQDASQSDEQVADSQDALSAGASQLVGSYWTHNPAFGGFARLDLKANGHYVASVDPAGTAFCITSPCLLPESGTWNATKKAGGAFRLRVRPTGDASRYYNATKSGGGETLSLVSGGKTETLSKLGANACLDDADCKTGEECGPRFCLMYCAVGDPFCCGPSTCQPTPPPPPPPVVKHCGGIAGIACAANEDCVDDPTDGCDPKHGGADCGGICQPKASPPGGTPCGPATCGVGKVCCNPLAGICTNPGEFCIQ